jgi:hypothetical protein
VIALWRTRTGDTGNAGGQGATGDTGAQGLNGVAVVAVVTASASGNSSADVSCPVAAPIATGGGGNAPRLAAEFRLALSATLRR